MSIHTTSTVKMPAGRYFIGDLCYVMHPQWDEFCSKTIDGPACRDGEVVLDNGVKVAQFCTMYGDGSYEDQLGQRYPVDAGLIGCIKIQDIQDSEAWWDGGNIIDFPYDFECSEDNGVIAFGHICINTGDEDEQEDEEVDERDEYND